MYEQALEWFRKACGLNAPLVLKCEGASQSGTGFTERLLRTPFVLIGRDPGADLVLDDAQVSRRHAFLHAVSGRILVTDLDSRTKVYWEGEEAPRRCGWLHPNGIIQVGTHWIRWTGQESENHDHGLQALFGPTGRDQSEVRPVPRAALELPIRVCDSPSLWPVEGELAMVGRADECQLVLTDDSVSRFHAVLVPTPLGLWVVDLLAREGVFVNGERVRWAWLADGDSLRIGRFTFILRYETAPDQITRQHVPLIAGATSGGHPGTELSLRNGPPGNGRRALAVRPRGPSLPSVKAENAPLAVEPDTIVPSHAELLKSMPFPANPMVMWRQQMQLMESFHNDMILMMQMFVAMHKEHSASVRHELDMVQKLTRELSALEARSAQVAESESAGPPASAVRPVPKRGPARTTDRQASARKRVPDQPDQNVPAESDATEPTGRSWDGAPNPLSAQGSGVSASNGPRSPGNAQVHAFLTERIAELQRERQGYWQRILSTINR